jgi:hypothetical protein
MLLLRKCTNPAAAVARNDAHTHTHTHTPHTHTHMLLLRKCTNPAAALARNDKELSRVDAELPKKKI